ncbi:MAG: YraN family protein [Zoogloeaceae bacterium]|jgi:putative endonuclease|nr:YraN family protein [Zoogloeaceae bacterium]
MPDLAKEITDGARAEALAADFLIERGMKILARNYRVKGGEIDLVAREGRVTVFVEVRLRRSARFGGAGASITEAKRRRLLLAARHWLATHGDTPCRFDCILLNRLSPEALTWVCDAIWDD